MNKEEREQFHKWCNEHHIQYTGKENYKARRLYERQRLNKRHRQERKEYNLKWRAEHPEYTKRQIQRAHNRYNNDPAYRSRQLLYSYKHFDREKNLVPADLSEYPTQDEINEMLLQPCVFCGESDWHKIGLDRIDNSLGHVRGNLQPCCWLCNKKKNKMTNEEFKKRIADGRIKLKDVSVAVPAMPTMRSLLTVIISENRPYLTVQPAEHVISLKSPKA